MDLVPDAMRGQQTGKPHVVQRNGRKLTGLSGRTPQPQCPRDALVAYDGVLDFVFLDIFQKLAVGDRLPGDAGGVMPHKE